ncbi:unnamed protein product [marine sediment metagenome]|uniref:Uncharacterized protein n=1 Tax=marine sediment metagenome TaxID=412755 RepID=X1IF88_9ZZZZ
MAKQEEIREGILRIVTEVDKAPKWEGFTHPNQVTKAIVGYLHSQGVVVKVDREFA